MLTLVSGMAMCRLGAYESLSPLQRYFPSLQADLQGCIPVCPTTDLILRDFLGSRVYQFVVA
jgi:hypothetical protein